MFINTYIRICVLAKMYIRVDEECIYVLAKMYIRVDEDVYTCWRRCIYVLAKMYIRVDEDVYTCWQRCIYVLTKMYIRVGKDVYTCWQRCIYVLARMYIRVGEDVRTCWRRCTYVLKNTCRLDFKMYISSAQKIYIFSSKDINLLTIRYISYSYKILPGSVIPCVFIVPLFNSTISHPVCCHHKWQKYMSTRNVVQNKLHTT